MTLTTTTSRADYNGNGSTTAFPVPFRFLQNADLRVIHKDGSGVETVLVLNTDYTVAGAGAATGTVTLTTAPANGETLTILRVVTPLQATSFRNQGSFFPETHEDALDLLTMIAQQSAERETRTLKLPESISGATVDTTLPAPLPGAALGWNADGDGLGNLIGAGSGTIEDARDLTLADLASTSDPAKGDALIGLKQPATGATARTIHDKFTEFLSVKDFGAKGDGSTDDHAAIQAALDIKGRIYVPAGTYRVSQDLTIYGNTLLFGDGVGKTIIKRDAPTGDLQVVLRDSSLVTSSDVNKNIVIEDIEFNGNSFSGSYNAGVVSFYRVGSCRISRCSFHDSYGTPFQFYGSMADTFDIRVTECEVYNSKNGDAFAACGTDITFDKCYAHDFKDTAFALLRDNNDRAATNPSGLLPTNVTWRDCVADGTTYAVSTGFATGPFLGWNTQSESNIRILNCDVRNCNVGAWLACTNGVLIDGCYFKPHKATDTGNVRLDGCSNVVISNSTINIATGTGSSLFCALLIQGIRTAAGDADSSNIKIINNTFGCNANDSIILASEYTYTGPTYVSKINNVVVYGNCFYQPRYCIWAKPHIGSAASICNYVTMRDNNIYGGTASTYFVNRSGSLIQFADWSMARTVINGSGALSTGVLVYQDSATAWAPAFTGLTTTGSPIITGNAYQVGKRMFIDVVIDPNGGTTASAGPGLTYINNLPVTSAAPGTGGVNDLNLASFLGGVSVSGNSARCDVVAWSSRSDYINISFSYPV